MSEYYDQNKTLINILVGLALVCLVCFMGGCFLVWELFISSKYIKAGPPPKGSPAGTVVIAKNKIDAFDGIINSDVETRLAAPDDIPAMAVDKLADAVDHIPSRTFEKGEVLRSHLLKKPQSARELTRLGSRYLKMDDKTRAVELFQEALKEDPHSSAAYEWLGHAYWKLDKPDQAVESFEKAVALDSTSDYSYNYLAYITLKDNDLDKTINYSQKAIKADPDNPEPYTYEGVAYYRQNKPKEAIEILTEAIRIKSDDGYPLYYRGRSYCRLKDYDKALVDVNKAIESDYWDLAGLYELKGRILAGKQNYHRAMIFFDRSLAVSDLFGAHIGKARCYLEQKDPTKALKEAALAVAAYPGDDKTREKKSIKNWRSYEIDPEPEKVAALVSNMMSKKAMLKEAEATLDRALARQPDSGLLYYERACLKEKLKDEAAAASDYAKAKELSYKPAQDAWMR